MIQLSDIHALTDFLRNHKDHIRRLQKAGRPEVLTINGRAELVVQDAASYQKLLDQVEQARTIAAIQRGLDDADAGRTRPADQVLKRLRRRVPVRPQR